MSIASNVILTNNNLTTARDKLRALLTTYGITYYSTDTVFTLTRRLKFIYRNTITQMYSYPMTNIVVADDAVSISAYVTDTKGNIREGIPVDFFVTVGGITTHYVELSDSNGWALCSFRWGESGEVDAIAIYLNGVEKVSESYEVKRFYFAEDSYDTSSYTVVKYPQSATLTSQSNTFDSNYKDYGIMISKDEDSSSAIYLVPKCLTGGIDATESGIHIQAKLVPKSRSSSGWACGIGLLASTSLTHYRDTKILELGAYPDEKGLKYSSSDHIIRDLNVATGELTLDGVWYTFDLYYKNGVVKATIKDNNTIVYSYNGSSQTFETAYPFLTIYDSGGCMIFKHVVVEEWSEE